MKLHILHLLTIFCLATLPAQANGKLIPEQENVQESIKETPPAPDSSFRDRLIRYILNHPEIPKQQDLLSRILQNEQATDEVFKKLPEKDRKAIEAQN